MKFQRRFANNFSFLNSYTFGESIDLNSDNDGTVTLTNVYDPEYNRGPSDYDITHTLLIELDLRAAVGARASVRRLAAQRHPLSAQRPAADGDADAGRAVHRHRQPAEPDLRRPPRQSDDRPLVRHLLLRAADRHHRHLRQHRAAGPFADRASSTSTPRSSRTRRSDASTPRFASRRSTCSTTRSSPTRTRRSATPPWARFRRCSRTRRVRSAAPSSGRCSSESK